MSVRTQIRNNFSFERKVFFTVVGNKTFLKSVQLGGIIEVSLKYKNTGTFNSQMSMFFFLLNEGHIKHLGNVLQWLHHLFLLSS